MADDVRHKYIIWNPIKMKLFSLKITSELEPECDRPDTSYDCSTVRLIPGPLRVSQDELVKGARGSGPDSSPGM